MYATRNEVIAEQEETLANSEVAIRRIFKWFVQARLGSEYGSKALPFYCDASRVGAFAVEAQQLERGTERALFQLLIALSMYQGLRDVVVMRHQRTMPKSTVYAVADLDCVAREVATMDCAALRSASEFETSCDVSKAGTKTDCSRQPQRSCHVKDATTAFNRMGDFGKLPTSARLQLNERGGMHSIVSQVCEEEADPFKRADKLVEIISRVHRVGVKLATMFVSAISTPALASLCPWYPAVDGNQLVVIDTNVSRAVDALRGPSATKTYSGRAQWIRRLASRLDLREFDDSLPTYSPRLVQEALYAFASGSNRRDRGDPCVKGSKDCTSCVVSICPFSH